MPIGDTAFRTSLYLEMSEAELYCLLENDSHGRKETRMIYCTQCRLPLTSWQERDGKYRIRCSGCHSVHEVVVTLIAGSDLSARELNEKLNKNK